MKTIQLTQDQVAIVDDADFEWLSQSKWYARWNPCTRSFYAVRNIPIEDSRIRRQRSVQMHREILGLKYGDRRQGDHINHNTLDNRLSVNLRIATHAENCFNRRKKLNTLTRLKGAGWESKMKKWKAMIYVGSNRIFLGYFDSPEEAHAAYCQAAPRYHGEFARTS